MRTLTSMLIALRGAFVLAAVATAEPARGAARAGALPSSASSLADGTDQEMRQLLKKLNTISEQIGRTKAATAAWRDHLAQADVLLEIAVRSKAEERDAWLRMAADSLAGAAAVSPESEQTAYQRLIALPRDIAGVFPGSTAINYAALQEIQSAYFRMLQKDAEHPGKAQEYLCERWVRFALEHPKAPESTKAMLDAGRTYEALGKTDEARRCYRYLASNYPGQSWGRKASGALWRLGMDGHPVDLELPPLYGSTEMPAAPFSLHQLRGKLVVIYFWSSTSPEVVADFVALKQLTDRYRDRDVEVVYVNLDKAPAQGRDFLARRLTAGVHLFQGGGIESQVAESFGIQSLPQAFLVGKDGALLRHSLKASQLEAEISSRVPATR